MFTPEFIKKAQRGLYELVEKSEIENKELIDKVQEIVVENSGEENTDTNVI